MAFYCISCQSLLSRATDRANYSRKNGEKYQGANHDSPFRFPVYRAIIQLSKYLQSLVSLLTNIPKNSNHSFHAPITCLELIGSVENLYSNLNNSTSIQSIMLRTLITIATIASCTFSAAFCNTESRLAADTRECYWRPWTLYHDSIYTLIETNLVELSASKSLNEADVFGYIDGEIEKMENQNLFDQYEIEIAAFKQLSLIRTIDNRDCMDHCSYVLARNNCNSGKYQQACFPRSSYQSFLKAVIDRRVFRLIERCYIVLTDRALELNSTKIDPNLYEYVTIIAKQLTLFQPTQRWNSIEDTMLESTKPFYSIRRLFKPIQAGYFDNLSDLMQRLERLKGGVELLIAIESRAINRRNAYSYYEQWILEPCREYIDEMHKAMDAVMFYGRIIELNRPRFESEEMSDDKKIKLYNIMYRYHACVYLDNHSLWDKNRIIKSLLPSE